MNEPASVEAVRQRDRPTASQVPGVTAAVAGIGDVGGPAPRRGAAMAACCCGLLRQVVPRLEKRLAVAEAGRRQQCRQQARPGQRRSPAQCHMLRASSHASYFTPLQQRTSLTHRAFLSRSRPHRVGGRSRSDCGSSRSTAANESAVATTTAMPPKCFRLTAATSNSAPGIYC